MKIQVDRDGNTVLLELDLGCITLQEASVMEWVLGGTAWDEFSNSGRLRPSVLRALIYAKLKGQYPDATIDDFDMDLNQLMEAVDG